LIGAIFSTGGSTAHGDFAGVAATFVVPELF
jgi:hypothetical protein